MSPEEKARSIVENAKASESHEVYDVLVIEFAQALREARADALEQAIALAELQNMVNGSAHMAAEAIRSLKDKESP